MLFIIATRYDPVTCRTFEIAQQLRRSAESIPIDTGTAFEDSVTRTVFEQIPVAQTSIIAFFGHGDIDGRFVSQSREPCVLDDSALQFVDMVLVAHACRAMIWLRGHFARLRLRALFAYDQDLITPHEGSVEFWRAYREIHCFVPIHVARGWSIAEIRLAFYSICTEEIDAAYKSGGGLVELIALEQSRDGLRVLQ